MAEAAGAEVPEAPLLLGLPDEIVVWEILVRLPPNSLLRCRAVCRAWRRATSARGFLLAHHDRQPTLPLLFEDRGRSRLDIVPFDHHRAAEDQLQFRPVARHSGDIFHLEASCDGLLLVCDTRQYAICNPATRQYAPLLQLDKFRLLGMYPHTLTGEEYRLLLLPTPDEPEPAGRETCHVFSLGSRQPPRNIGNGWPEPADRTPVPVPVLFRGGLHWHLDNMIMVFDTAAESFRQTRSPVHGGHGPLFEMDGMIAMYNFTDASATVIDIWVLQDYKNETWAFKCRVGLLAEEIKAQFGNLLNHWNVVATASCCDGNVMFLVRFGKWLHQVDIHGNLVGSFHVGLLPTQLHLKQTLVLHAFFPKLKGYAVNASPFGGTYFY